MRGWPLSLEAVILSSMLFSPACSVQSLVGPDDKAIVSDIQAKLFQDSVLKTRDIRLTANKGMVILTGTVNTDLEKSQVERMARQESGVNQVENQLSVSSPITAQVTRPVIEEAPPERPATPAPERPRARAAERLATKREHRETDTRNASSTEAKLAPSEAPNNPPAPIEIAAPPPPLPPPPPKPIHATIPAGTVITVRMVDGVDSVRDHPGQEFTASVESPIVVGERVVVPRGADARVRLVSAKNSGRMTGQSELQLQLSGVTVAGSNYDAESTTYSQLGNSRSKRTAETVGGGAILGGLIGAIAGHGKGAAIGSVIGAGAGTAAEAGTKAAPLRVPSETKLDFTLKTPISVTLPPRNSTAQEPQ